MLSLQIKGPFPGHNRGELYQAYWEGDFAGEVWLADGRIKLLDVWENYRHRGIASALLDHVLRLSPELIYELDDSEPDGFAFLQAYEKSRNLKVNRGPVHSLD